MADALCGCARSSIRVREFARNSEFGGDCVGETSVALSGAHGNGAEVCHSDYTACVDPVRPSRYRYREAKNVDFKVISSAAQLLHRLLH